MEWTLVKGAHNASKHWPQWLYKRKRGKSFPLGKAFVCDGNRGMSMSEDDGCSTGAPRLTKMKRAGSAMKITDAEGDVFGLEIAPKQYRILYDSMMLHFSP